MAIEYKESARVGRKNQLYSSSGARLVAGCVCLNTSRDKVLLVSSSAKPKKWVLPKGGVESDEPDYVSAAIRETWEEAGVTGDITGKLPVVEDMRPPKHWGSMKEDDRGVLTHPPRSEFHFYEMAVEREHDKYPECKERRRCWFTYEDAVRELRDNKRLELAACVESSSVQRN